MLVACGEDSGASHSDGDAAAATSGDDSDDDTATGDDDSSDDDTARTDDDSPDDDSGAADDDSPDDDSGAADDDSSDDDSSDDDSSDDDTSDDDSGAADDDSSDDDGSDDDTAAADDVAGPDAGTDSNVDGGLVSPPAKIPDDYLSVFESGSRLKVRSYVMAGAPNEFVGFYDSELGTNCTFYAVQGELGCLPDPDIGMTRRGFASPDCTDEVVTVPACAPADVFTRESVGPCRSDIEVRRYGELNQSVVLYDFDDNGDCVEVSASVDFADTGRIDMGVVEPDAFVLGQQRLLATAGQLTLAVVDAADGAVGPLWLVDIALNARCDAEYAPEPRPCYPTRRAWADSSFFWDDMCTEPASLAYEATPRECDDVDYVVDPVAAQGEPVLYQVGAEVTDEVWAGGASCTSRNDAGWLDHMLEVGDPVTVSPANMVGIQLGDGRLQSIASSEGDTPMLLSQVQFWDTQLQAYCQPQKVNGQLRCLPGTMSSWTNAWGQYSDPACTAPLVYCNTGSCEDTLYFESDEAEGSCGTSNYSSLKRLSEPVVDQVYELQGSDCVGPVDPFNAWTWQDVDPGEFAPIDLVVDP
jgi:hypothetical protein